MTTAWELRRQDGLVVVRNIDLLGIRGWAHGFSTRRDGDSDGFDLGRAEETGGLVGARRARLLRACGIAGGSAVVLRQVHGVRVVDATAVEDGEEADGCVLAAPPMPGRAPAVRTADCVPMLLADREGFAAAAVHAGWRGVSMGAGEAAVTALRGCGVPPARLAVALGPAIGPCCYEVSDDVAQALVAASDRRALSGARTAAGRPRVDLREALRVQLLRLGVPETSVHVAPWCTRCRRDLFFSHRRDGARAGRMMACIGPSGAVRFAARP